MSDRMLRLLFWLQPNGVTGKRSDLSPYLGSDKSLYICVLGNHCEPEWLYIPLNGQVKENLKRKKVALALKKNYATGNSLAVSKSKIYKVGISSANGFVTKEMHVLDTHTLRWSKGPPMIGARGRPKIFIVDGGDILVMGGHLYSNNGKRTVWAEKLGNASQKWLELTNLSQQFPHDDASFHAAVVPPIELENEHMIVFGSFQAKLLYRFHVGTQELVKLESGKGGTNIPGDPRQPPVVVENRMLWFYGGSLCAYDVCENWICYGTVEGLDELFLCMAFSPESGKRLLYIGNGCLCLICLQEDVPIEGSVPFRVKTKDESILHFFVFSVPTYSVDSKGRRSLDSQLCCSFQHTIQKADSIFDALLVDDENDGAPPAPLLGSVPASLPKCVPVAPDPLTRPWKSLFL